RRPVAELRHLSVPLSDHRVDETGALVPVEPSDFRQAWEQPRKRPARWSVGPADLLAWHRRRAEECAAARSWHAAVAHLDALIAAEPGVWAHYAARGQALAEFGRWPEAQRDLEKTLDLGADRPGPYSDLALVCLQQDDRVGYRAACRRMLARFGVSQSPTTLGLLVDACTAAPGALDEPA